MSKWNKLTPKEKAAFARIALKNGITKTDDIREVYNSFDEGGLTTSLAKKPFKYGGKVHKYDGLSEKTGMLNRLTTPLVEGNEESLVSRETTPLQEVPIAGPLFQNYSDMLTYLRDHSDSSSAKDWFISPITYTQSPPGNLKSFLGYPLKMHVGEDGNKHYTYNLPGLPSFPVANWIADFLNPNQPHKNVGSPLISIPVPVKTINAVNKEAEIIGNKLIENPKKAWNSFTNSLSTMWEPIAKFFE